MKSGTSYAWEEKIYFQSFTGWYSYERKSCQLHGQEKVDSALCYFLYLS